MISKIYKTIEKGESTEKINIARFYGLSTDTKPMPNDDEGVNNGAQFVEIDTSKFYLFDAEGEMWHEFDLSNLNFLLALDKLF